MKSQTQTFSLESEGDLLGRILSNEHVLSQLSFLKPQDFYSPAHADVYFAMHEVHRLGESVTPFSVVKYLKRPEAFEEAGGALKYLVACMRKCGHVIYPSDLARSVKDMANRRKMAEICLQYAGNAIEDTKSFEEQIITLKSALEELCKGTDSKLFQTNIDVTQEIIDDLNSQKEPFSSGIEKLDAAMDGGLYPGKSYGFAARKKAGKTALAATISANLNANEHRHLFICAEMGRKEIQQRILCRLTDSFPSAFRTEYGKSESFSRKLENAIAAMKRNTIFHDAPGITFPELQRVLLIAAERHKITGFILDYWQLVGGKQKGQSTAEHLDEVAQWIAAFSRKHGLWSITMAQLNQDGNTRGSEGIRLAFDQIYEIHREDVTMPQAWLEMLETRYTKWQSIGDNITPGLYLNPKGPFYQPIGEAL